MTHMVLTNYWRSCLLQHFLESLANTNHYVFVSRYTPWTDDDDPDEADESLYVSHYLPHREMIYAKKFDDTDCAYLVTRNVWTTNTLYSAYDDRDEELRDKTFFVITDERKVYKCLFNNANTRSTSKPTTTANTPFQTGDGYIWKYMFTVTQAKLDAHETSTLFPIEANATIEEAAIDGALDVILVETNGNNWVATTNGTIVSKVSNTLFQIANAASTSNDIYVDSAMYIQAGNGAGLLSVITDYVSNSTGNFVTLATAMSNVTLGSQYLITPQIRITGDGSGAKAYCTVNANTFKIQDVSVINVGSGYSRATVNAVAAAGVGNTSVVLRAVIGPPGGHGSNPVDELMSQRLSISIDIESSDAMPSNVDFRTAGIIKAPLARNSANAFVNAEIVQHYRANIALGVGITSPFSNDEVITGQTSGATGTVLWSNTTYLRFSSVLGTFANAETIIGANSSVAATISAINTPDVEENSGEVLCVQNFEPIVRTAVTNETVRVILKV